MEQTGNRSSVSDSRGELNVGCLWGPRSKLIDIEQDSDDDKAAFAELFHGVDAPVTPTFQSTRGPHRIFSWHPKLDNIGKATIHYKGLEVKIGANGKGSQSLLPPSTTNRFSRRWLIPLDDCPPAKLPDLVIDRLFSDSSSSRQIVYTETQAIACVSVSLCKHPSEAIGEAIAASLPTGTGHRHRRLFHFARLLKAIPSLASADVQSLRPIMQEWYRQALPKIGTRNFDESWTDFAHAWRNVRFPAGQEPIRMMYEQALLAPLPPIAERYETVEVKRLIVLCRALQQASARSRSIWRAAPLASCWVSRTCWPINGCGCSPSTTCCCW